MERTAIDSTIQEIAVLGADIERLAFSLQRNAKPATFDELVKAMFGVATRLEDIKPAICTGSNRNQSQAQPSKEHVDE